MIGQLTSLDPLERNVDVRITSDSLFSEISDINAEIDAHRVSGYVIDQRNDVYHLLIKVDELNSDPVDFYRTRSKGDLALLLDLLDGTIGDRPRELRT